MVIRPAPITREFALGAIQRLEARKTGRPSFDAWIVYAIRQWRDFLDNPTTENPHVTTPRQ